MAATAQTRARPAWRPAWRKWLRRLGGALLVSTFLVLLIGGWSYHRARAQLSEGLYSLGAEMMRYDGARRQDAPRQLVLNGQTVHLSSGNAERSLTSVLDFFEARCSEVDGAIVEQTEAAIRQYGRSPRAPAGDPAPVLREERNGRGFVACLDLGRQSLSATEILDRVRRYNASGDVHDIGDVRYVFAEGDARSTHFVALWTDGSFNLRQMFPEVDDAPGTDPRDAPRPPGARRALHAFERGQPESLTVYWSRQTDSELESHYRASLPRNGFRIVEHPERAPDPNAPRTLVAMNGSRMLTIVVRPEGTHGSSAAVFATR